MSTDFTYLGDGGMALMLQSKTGGVTTDYIYGADGQVVEQYTSTARSFLHHDQIGSVRIVTDSVGAKAGTASYSSFGGVLAQTGTVSVFGYAGEYTDTETAFVYLRARYYDPATSQFLNRDPAFGSTLSAYAYGNNSPTNMTDPSGLDSCQTNPMDGTYSCSPDPAPTPHSGPRGCVRSFV